MNRSMANQAPPSDGVAGMVDPRSGKTTDNICSFVHPPKLGQDKGFPPFTGQQLTAYKFISGQLLDGAPNADIRTQYANEALAQNFASDYPTKLAGLTAPTGVPAADWSSVVKQLSTEFGYVADVDSWFALHERFIGELNQSDILSVGIVSGKIQFPSDGSKNNESVLFNILSLIARVVQGIGSLTGQPEVSAITGLFSAAFSAAGLYSGQNENQPNILATVVALQDKLNTHFQNAVLANGCMATYYLQDWTLLESIGLPIAQGKYKWDQTLDGKLLAAARPAYELGLWQALTPVAWEFGDIRAQCFGPGSCEIPGDISNYPGGYTYFVQFDDNYGFYYFIKLKGVDYGGAWQPPVAALNALFQPPPNGLGVNFARDVLQSDDPDGWHLDGPTPP